MSLDSEDSLTQLIQRAGKGDEQARNDAAQRLYHELRNLATALMRNERQVTLQPTALANEAFMRLVNSEAIAGTPDRGYFFAAAGRAMRQILVDEARRRRAKRRGGDHQQQPFEETLAQYERQNIDLIALDESLQELERISPRQARVVHMRWFLELTVQEVAELLEVSISTVEQDWRLARAFLKRSIDST